MSLAQGQLAAMRSGIPAYRLAAYMGHSSEIVTRMIHALVHCGHDGGHASAGPTAERRSSASAALIWSCSGRKRRLRRSSNAPTTVLRAM